MAEILRIISQLLTLDLDFDGFIESLQKVLKFCSDCSKDGRECSTETLDIIRSEIISRVFDADKRREEAMGIYFEERALANLLEGVRSSISEHGLAAVVGEERLAGLTDSNQLSQTKKKRDKESMRIVTLAERIHGAGMLLEAGAEAGFDPCGDIGELLVAMLGREMEAGKVVSDFLDVGVENRDTVMRWLAGRGLFNH